MHHREPLLTFSLFLGRTILDNKGEELMELILVAEYWYLPVIVFIFIFVLLRLRSRRTNSSVQSLQLIFDRLRHSPDVRNGHPYRTTTGHWDWHSDDSGTLVLCSWNKDELPDGEKFFSIDLTMQWPSGSSVETVVAKLCYDFQEDSWREVSGTHKLYTDDYQRRRIPPSLWREITQLPNHIGSQPYWHAEHLTLVKSA